ncbi:MAG: aminotransferase class III-fold pyridoxal phosphate-dependent enzyme [Gemmataceae bacterium]
MTELEPHSLRTFTPTQAVLAKSAGVFHWTPEGRRLYDFSSGVLVANLGHNPTAWTKRLFEYMGWDHSIQTTTEEYFEATTLTAYNAVTNAEVEATRRLVELMRARAGGSRMEQVMCAASGSEAIQKALWCSLARDPARDMIIATRYGFHGKKGLAGAVTGTEQDHDRDPRVKFISFPMCERIDVSQRDEPFDVGCYLHELKQLKHQFGRRLGTLITEPYLGGGGSYHPRKQYLQALEQFCREKDINFILDEIQSNFGRTGKLFAYETYGIEPDVVVLGKGLANGIPVAAAVGLREVIGALGYGEGSDTWSAATLSCAGVLATLDEFAARDVIAHTNKVSSIIEEGLIALKQLPFINYVRGEKGGMVWGVEACDYSDRSANEWANQIVLSCYSGEDHQGIHLLGPLAGKVVRIAPPLTITETQAKESLALMNRLLEPLAREHAPSSSELASMHS